MAVVNLGSSARQKSPLSGFSDALSVSRTLKQRERERVSREKLQENQLSSKLADQEIRKSVRDIDNVRKTHEQFSLWWNGMNAQEQAIAKTSEQYKEMQKFFKGFKQLVPGLVKDDGTIVASTNKDIFVNKLNSKVAQAKLNIANGTSTKEDVALVELTIADKDDLADILDKVTKESKPSDIGDAQGFRQKLGQIIAGRKFQPRAAQPNATQRVLAGDASVPGVTQPQAIQPQAPGSSNRFNTGLANSQDPLGIFGR